MPNGTSDPVEEARKALRQAISARGDNTIAPYHSPSHTCDRSIAALESAIRQQAQQDHSRLLSEHRAMREALIEAVLPYEAIRADKGSQIWIAPSVWEHIVRATDKARATLAGVTR